MLFFLEFALAVQFAINAAKTVGNVIAAGAIGPLLASAGAAIAAAKILQSRGRYSETNNDAIAVSRGKHLRMCQRVSTSAKNALLAHISRNTAPPQTPARVAHRASSQTALGRRHVIHVLQVSSATAPLNRSG